MKSRNRTRFIVIHCSDEPARRKTGVKEIRRWHRAKGWLDIGYHYVIKTDGTVEVGRKHDVMGAHVRGHNQHSLGICMIGGSNKDLTGPEDNFTRKQWESLDQLLRSLRELYPFAEIKGHNELDDRKACPSFDVQEYLKSRSV